MHLELEERTKFAPPARLISRLSYSQQIRSTSILCNQNPTTRLKFKLTPIYNNMRMITSFLSDLKLVIITETPRTTTKGSLKCERPQRLASAGRAVPSSPPDLPRPVHAFRVSQPVYQRVLAPSQAYQSLLPPLPLRSLLWYCQKLSSS